jgi:predicted aspartyl protease
MRRKLDRAFHPPAAVASVRVRAPNGVDSAELDGKLDTGADVCAVPERLVDELALPPLRTVRASGYGGVSELVTAYRIDVEIDGLRIPRVEALVTRRHYAIIGRNVLCRLILRVDGPRETFELKGPRRASRGAASHEP